MLPTSLRARIAMVALLSIFLIPIANSSLRGLTHVLTCEDQAKATLSIDNTTGDESILLSADTVTAEDVAGLCGGLLVDLQLASTSDTDADVLITITNQTDHDWQGSIELEFAGTTVPIAIGSIDSGQQARDTVTLAIEPDRNYEISGTLLIGP